MKTILALLLIPWVALATPSSLFWTYCTTDVLDLGEGNFSIDNLFKVVTTREDFPAPFQGTIPEQMFPTDIGFEVGLLKVGCFNVETGVDYLAGTVDPLFFNAKIGIDENKLFWNAPSFSVGIFDVGTAPSTAFNVVDFVVGKTLPRWIGGRLFVGGFLCSEVAGEDRAGWWVGYQVQCYKKKDCKGREFYRWNFLADYASGRNVVGGGGFGVAYYYNKDINLQTGPTWFNSAKIFGSWKWALYLNINFPVFRVCCYGDKK